MNAEEVFRSYVAAINHHEVEDLMAWTAGDQVFVDSLGNRATGQPSMKLGWSGYFVMCPDYLIRIDTVMVNDDVVLAEGEAGGTIDGVAWRTPAAWMAVIRKDKVAEWRVFADNKPVYDILARRT